MAKTRTLVCGTCVGLGRVHFGITKNRYDWVIVDEAARATPSELAVAIQAGRRVLLVGDHRQLPPLYTQEVVDNICMRLGCADKAILTRSASSVRLSPQYGQKVGATLQIQYRMAPAIGELVSACFYPSPLLPGRGDPEHGPSRLPPFAQAVVTWIDTSDVGPESYEKRKEGNPSRRRLSSTPLARSLAPGGRLLGDPVLRPRSPPRNNPGAGRGAASRSAATNSSARCAANCDANSTSRISARSRMRRRSSAMRSSRGPSRNRQSDRYLDAVRRLELPPSTSTRSRSAAGCGRHQRDDLAATQRVLQRHGGLSFDDEAFVVTRRRD